VIALIGTGSQQVKAQGWEWLSPLPQGNTLYDATFSDAQTGWAVGAGGTVIRTTDGGTTWEICSIPDAGSYDLRHVLFPDAEHGWIQGYDWSNSLTQSVVLRTEDGGQSWRRMPSPLFDYIWGMTFPDPRHGFAAGNNWGGAHELIVLKTADGGVTWEPLILDTARNGGNTISFADSLHGAVMVTNGILHTADGGVSWSLDTLNLRDMEYTDDVTFADTLHGWACTTYGRLLNTDNGGITWQRMPEAIRAHSPLRFVDSLNGWSFGGGIQHTTDGGFTWTVWPNPLNLGIEGLWARDALSTFAVGRGGVVLHSTDGGTQWIQIAGASNVHYDDVQFANPRNGWMIQSGWDNLGSYSHLLHTTDGGTTWSREFVSDTLPISKVSFPDSVHGWAMSSTGQVFRTTNGGTIWSEAGHVFGEGIGGFLFADATHGWTSRYSEGHYDTYISIYHTQDGGANWTEQYTTTGSYGWTFSEFVFINARMGWALGSHDGTLLYTTNGGTNWQTFNLPVLDIFDLAAMDSLRIWVATDYDGLMLTTDGGTTWRNPYQGDAGRLAFGDSLNGWMTGSGRMLHTTDGGWTWRADSLRVANAVYSLSSPDARHAWAAGYDGTLLRYTDNTLAAPASGPSRLPADYSLSAFPNPFNSTTTLHYSLVRHGQVTLTVYDLLGREAATLVNTAMQSGTHTIPWDAGGKSSGIYWAVLRAGGEQRVQKLMLLK
jgi:photosystem II stability/assembly factor-like uncharacterized protein